MTRGNGTEVCPISLNSAVYTLMKLKKEACIQLRLGGKRKRIETVRASAGTDRSSVLFGRTFPEPDCRLMQQVRVKQDICLIHSNLHRCTPVGEVSRERTELL